MKKFLLTVAAATLGLSSFAASVTFDLKTSTYGITGQTAGSNANTTYVTCPATMTNGDVSVELTGDASSWRFWTDGLRIYKNKNAAFTVSVPAGSVINKIEWTVASGATFALDGTTNNITSWTGSAESVKFNSTNNSGTTALVTLKVTYDDGNGGTTDPDPVDPTPTPEGTISVAEALEFLSNGYTGPATVKGIISSIDELSISYGNATYFIKDELSDTQSLEIYRGYSLNGAKFTSEKEIEVGGTVVVSGTLVNFNGTYEFTTGSKILEYTAPENSGEDDNDDPTKDSESVTFNFADPSSLEATDSNGDNVTFDSADATEYNMTNVTLKAGVISMAGTAPEGTASASSPRLFLSSGSTVAWTYRFYNNNTITISAEEEYAITGITFTASNLGATSITWSTGSFSNNKLTIQEPVSEVVIKKTATGNNPTITNMTVYYTKSSVVENFNIEVNNTPEVFYNLQGVKVNNPVKGQIYIVNGKKVVF